MKTEHAPGPWRVAKEFGELVITAAGMPYVAAICDGGRHSALANARLIAAAPCQHKEMLRYLPVLERAEADPEIWNRLTEGLGIATANSYRAAISKATTEAP